ncbi:hypothetical protein [Pseudomonas sp. NCCP-436]|uniref:hypothetical protein n=1 Tax=Pseudomonas sp. NCCP-436 TaxID=2842481 RepID=UPI001D5955A9|nr:hypothetical protein [Pseudomonas sp. NCCP-436]GIZ13223.1 hypothetical protein NCCP436_26390 [Pseudomonas sp. NCCP-436]
MTASITSPRTALPAALAGLLTIVLLAGAWHLADGSNEGRAFSYSLVSGALFGLLGIVFGLRLRPLLRLG